MKYELSEQSLVEFPLSFKFSTSWKDKDNFKEVELPIIIIIRILSY